MKKLHVSLLVALFAITVAAWASSKTTTVSGWVVDDMCGVKGARAGAEECARKCLNEGAKMVVVTDTDKRLLYVENPDALKEHIGAHVSVQGTVDGDKLHVESAQATTAGK
ncbi:MAG: hypothetical protein ACE14L_15790 [Terriglobales bacterium]